MNDRKRHRRTCTVFVCLAPPIAQVRELKTCTHTRVTEGRRELDSYSFNSPGLFHSQGRLHDPFEGELRNTHNNTCINSVVHGNLKPFVALARVIRGRGVVDLYPRSQEITETFNRLMRNLSEPRK